MIFLIPEISITSITEPIIYRYAQNAGLFAEDGVLTLLFEEGVRCKQAIANYLHEDQSNRITITSQVQTLF